VKTIQVSEETWEKLQEIRIKKRYRKIEDVIKELLEKAGELTK